MHCLVADRCGNTKKNVEKKGKEMHNFFQISLDLLQNMKFHRKLCYLKTVVIFQFYRIF